MLKPRVQINSDGRRSSPAKTESPFKTQLTYSPLPVLGSPAEGKIRASQRLANKENIYRGRIAAMGLLEPDELERELEQRNDEREEMLRKIKSLSDKNQSVKEALKREESIKRHQMLIMKKTHETQLEIKNSLIKNLEDIIDEQEARIFNLESHIAGIRTVTPVSNRPLGGVTRLVGQIEELSTKNVSLIEQLTVSEESQAEVEKSVDELRAKLDSKLTTLATENGDLNRGDLEKQLATLSSENGRLLKENRNLKEEGTLLKQVLNQQKSDFARVELAQSEETLNAEKALLKVNQKNAELNRESDYLKVELTNLQAQLNSLKHKDHEVLVRVQQSQEDFELLRDQLEDERQQSRRLRVTLDESEIRCAQTRDELIKANQLLGDLQKENHSRNEAVVEYKRTVERLNEVINKMRRESANWEQKHADAVIALDCFKASLKSLRDAQTELLEQTLLMPAEFQQKLIEARQQICRQVSSAFSQLVGKYKMEMALRKKYHNALVELKGNIRVFCRVRPLIALDGQADTVAQFDSDDDSVIHMQNNGKRQTFYFDKVFTPQQSQMDIFDEVRPLVTSCVDGYNVCILAYGQTGSGKTYTMQGPTSNPGINQRALAALFEEAKMREPDWKFCISVSMLEIYNETIRDLLSLDNVNMKLDVKLNGEGGLHVPGLTCIEVGSLSDVNKIFAIGQDNRATAMTLMNDYSSRSHALLCVSITGFNQATKVKTTGKLNLVDLAGSERVSKSAASGDRLKEAQAINKSLSALGDVICALRNKQTFVPFRNSKLTYLLQDSLAGDSKMLMVVQVADNVNSSAESICSLNFAQRVSCVELGPTTAKITNGQDKENGSQNGDSTDSPTASPLHRIPSRNYGTRSKNGTPRK